MPCVEFNVTIHSTFRKGKRVFVILKNGEQIIDKYVGKTSKSIILEEAGHILIKDIRATTIYRQDPHKEESDGN